MANTILAFSNPVTSTARAPVASASLLPTVQVTPTTDFLSTRREVISAAVAALTPNRPALAFEFGMTAPDQTLEEAQVGMRIHGRGLLAIKTLLEERSWKEAQVELRENAAALKQDLYTMIQSAPVKRRSELRKLYSNLFNNVTRLDFAARSKDENLVQEHYWNIVAVLNDIITKI